MILANFEWLSPLLVTIMGGIGTALLAIANNWWQWFQSQSLEETKLRATLIQKALEAPTAEARKNYLLFLVKAGLITDPGDKIKNLDPDEIPSEFSFVKSAALTPELASVLEKKLKEFQDYLRSIGLQADTKSRVHICPHNEMTESAYCYYNPEAEGGPQLVVDSQYAEDADLVLREYCHHVLSANRPAGLPVYSGPWKAYWPHFSIESALAYYLPCSFNNNPIFAAIAVRKGLPSIDLTKSHTLTELVANQYAMYEKNAEIWGHLFWKLRGKLGGQKIDPLLVRAWFTLTENTPADAQTKAFGRALEHIAAQTLNTDAVAEIRKILAAHRLSL